MKFELSKEQIKIYEEWRDKELKDVLQDELGVREMFLFVPCSAGVAVKVLCGKHQLDLTEYDRLGGNKK